MQACVVRSLVLESSGVSAEPLCTPHLFPPYVTSTTTYLRAYFSLNNATAPAT
jgi:hypothetical protein